MKILIFATQYMPTGGIESHLKEFCREMVGSGVEVDLVITNSAMLPETEDFFRQICQQVYLGKQGRSNLRMFWLLSVGVKLWTNYYDALYTNGQGESVALFSRLIRFRFWVHHHHTAGDLADQAYWGKRYRKTLLNAHRVIACSKRNANDMEVALARNINVVPCFSQEVKVQSGLGSNFLENRTTKRIRFGYYGRLIPEKGIELICQLSQEPEFEEVEFHLWGQGAVYPESFFQKFHRVKYHGPYSSREELAEIIEFIDAFLLLSSHAEGLPISLLEAMSAGLPWLATDRGGIRDIACDPQSTRVIAVSLDYSQVKEAVLSFASDLRAGRFSKNAQMQLYAQKFSSSALISQWREVLSLGVPG